MGEDREDVGQQQASMRNFALPSTDIHPAAAGCIQTLTKPYLLSTVPSYLLGWHEAELPQGLQGQGCVPGLHKAP